MDTRAFVESSELHVVVPQSTQADIDNLFTNDELEDSTERKRSAIGVGERSLLHFGSCY